MRTHARQPMASSPSNPREPHSRARCRSPATTQRERLQPNRIRNNVPLTLRHQPCQAVAASYPAGGKRSMKIRAAPLNYPLIRDPLAAAILRLTEETNAWADSDDLPAHRQADRSSLILPARRANARSPGRRDHGRVRASAAGSRRRCARPCSEHSPEENRSRPRTPCRC